MSKVTGYVLFGLGVFTIFGGVILGDESFVGFAFIGILLITFGIAIIAKNDKKQEPVPAENLAGPVEIGKEKETRNVARNGFVMAAAIISLFISLTMASVEISQFMDYSGYTLVDTISGMMGIQGILTVVSCILFFIGWWNNDGNKVLTASILSCVAAAFMPLYIVFYALPIIFGFIGYSRIKKDRQ